MKIKVDPKKLQERLEQQQQSATRKKYDPKDSIILKPEGPGKLNFRASYYCHNDDPSVEPFVERFYHYGFPGGAFYCPKKNCGEDCFICDFVWQRLAETKGTDAAKEWNKKLPAMCMLVPGLIRGREDEGCKFFRVGTREDKPSANYKKIYGWFSEDDTAEWIDPDVGYDMELTYETPDEEQSNYLRGAKTILKSIDLARKSTKFGAKKEFETFMTQMPNIDEDSLYGKKTTADSLEVLNKFHEILSKKAARSGLKAPEVDQSAGISVKEEETTTTVAAENKEELDGKLKSMGL